MGLKFLRSLLLLASAMSLLLAEHQAMGAVEKGKVRYAPLYLPRCLAEVKLRRRGAH